MRTIREHAQTRMVKKIVDLYQASSSKESTNTLLFHERELDMRWQIANEVRRAELAVTNLISSKREWNNCFIKFGTLVYLEITAKFYKTTGS